MARIRSVKPEFNTSQAIADLDEYVQLFFVKLWTYADDYGRGLDNPRLLLASLYPLSDTRTAADMAAFMDALEAGGRVERYSVDDKCFFEVVNWMEHQHPKRRVDSVIPPPDHPSARRRAPSRAQEEPEPRVTEDYARQCAPVVVGVEVGVGVEGVDGAASGADLFGFPIQASEGKTYTQTVAEHLKASGAPIAKQPTRSEDYRRVVEVVGEKLGGYPGLTRLQARVIREYAAELGHDMDGSEFGHLLRLVGERGALACLRDVAEAMSRGAGLDPEWADKSRRVTRYAASVGKAAS